MLAQECLIDLYARYESNLHPSMCRLAIIQNVILQQTQGRFHVIRRQLDRTYLKIT